MSVLDQVVAERDALREQLRSLEQELRRIIDESYGENFSDDMEGLDEILGALENLNSIISARDKQIVQLEEELRAYREMFPCSICGKPMIWKPDDNLGQALKAFVKEGRWGHGPCVNPRKQ